MLQVCISNRPSEMVNTVHAWGWCLNTYNEMAYLKYLDVTLIHNLIDTILLMSGWGIYILVLLGDLPMAIAIATLCGIQFRLISLD